MNLQVYLDQIDRVIHEGKFKATWESLGTYGEPVWYNKAKFGIFIHWGVYSVPAFANEWYARNMYIKGSREYEHHIKTYGEHKEFGYADFVPLFKAENFDPSEWMQLFKEAGAKFVVPVAEHHDGFQMYQSEISSWNSAQMGPHRDVLGELKVEADKEGIILGASSHRAENYWFFSGCRDFDSGLEKIEFQEPYGYAYKLFEHDDLHSYTHNIDSIGPSVEHILNWLVRTCEIIDKYQPSILWFDWSIQNKAFKPYLKKLAAYYYNRSIEWGKQVAINYKFDTFAYGTAIYDVERGQLADIRPRLWQNDTAIAKNSWCYTENNEFKTPESLVEDLIDVTSKNGCMLLNVGPKSDGTITQEDQAVLKGIGQWLRVNGEGIYDTTYWKVFGEGPTEIVEGSFVDNDRLPYTKEDIRFTYKAPYIYAFVMKWPKDNAITIRSLKQYSRFFSGDIKAVNLLGYTGEVDYSMTENGLSIQYKGVIEMTYPVGIKITVD